MYMLDRDNIHKSLGPSIIRVMIPILMMMRFLRFLLHTSSHKTRGNHSVVLPPANLPQPPPHLSSYIPTIPPQPHHRSRLGIRFRDEVDAGGRGSRGMERDDH